MGIRQSLHHGICGTYGKGKSTSFGMQKSKNHIRGVHMKTKALKILLIIESTAIVLFFLWVFLVPGSTELLHESSPNGDYELIIRRIGGHDIFSPDHIKVLFRENNGSVPVYCAQFEVDINAGISPAKCAVEWQENGAEVVLCGMKSQYYIFPFKTLKDAKKSLYPYSPYSD